MQAEIRKDGIECFSFPEELNDKKFDVITMFHVLEHLKNPIEILQSLATLLDENGRIVIEVPNADDALLSLYKNTAFADFTYWMCHLYLYNNTTLRTLIEKAGMKLEFMQQVQRYPLSNHLMWLSCGKPGGHQKWAALSDCELDKNYGAKLSQLGIADTIVAIVGKKS